MSEPSRRSSHWLTGFVVVAAIAAVVLALSSSPRTVPPTAAPPSSAIPSTEVLGAETTRAPIATQTTFSDNDPLTLYISPNGSDANTGQSPEVPFQNFKHAIRLLQPGMTLFVMDGTYNLPGGGPTHVGFTKNGAPDKWTRITAAPGAKPVIVATQGAAFEALGSYIEISGLTIRGEGFSESNSYGYGVLVGDGHHFNISYNTVSGFPVGGIAAVRASHLNFSHNVVFENSYWGTEQGSGLSTWVGKDFGIGNDANGYTDYFVGNTIYRNENRVTSRFVPGRITDGNGIIIDTNIESGFTGRTLIANNVIFDNGGRSIMVYLSQSVDVVNNTTYGNGQTGDALAGGGAELVVSGSRDVGIYNNLLWNSESPTIVLSRSSDLEATNNAFVGELVGASPDQNLVLTDPGIIAGAPSDVPTDFVPRPDSPLVDAGVAVGPAAARDFAGVTRPVGAAVDIGAFESNPGQGVAVPPSTTPPSTTPPSTTPPSTAPPSTVAPTTTPPTTAPAAVVAPTTAPSTSAPPSTVLPTDERAAASPAGAAAELLPQLPTATPATEGSGVEIGAVDGAVEPTPTPADSASVAVSDAAATVERSAPDDDADALALATWNGVEAGTSRTPLLVVSGLAAAAVALRVSDRLRRKTSSPPAIG